EPQGRRAWSPVPPGRPPCIERVVGQKAPALTCDEAHGVDDELHRGLGVVPAEAYAGPPRPDTVPAGLDPWLELGRGGLDEAAEAMANGSRKGATTSSLDAEKVVEESHDEAVVEGALTASDHKAHRREPRRVEVPQEQ